MDYQPDNWVVLKITYDNQLFYKVLAGWSGGYLDGDSWRMNSGVSRVERDGDFYLFYGASGSCYRCHSKAYRLSMATTGVYNQLCERFTSFVHLMPEDTVWVNIDYAI